MLFTNLKRIVGEEQIGGRARAAKTAAARQAVAVVKRAAKKKSAAKAKGAAARALTAAAKAVRAPDALVGCRAIQGAHQVQRVLEVDQTPIGKTPRSCPATYVGFWDEIRAIFAGTTEARIRGYDRERFSALNAGSGRCEGCEGQGLRTIEMSFLPDVKVGCDVCNGQRFNSETLSVLWRGRSIGNVLNMSIDDAVDFFARALRARITR